MALLFGTACAQLQPTDLSHKLPYRSEDFDAIFKLTTNTRQNKDKMNLRPFQTVHLSVCITS